MGLPLRGGTEKRRDAGTRRWHSRAGAPVALALIGLIALTIGALVHSAQRRPISDEANATPLEPPVRATAAASGRHRQPVYPLEADASGRYLVDQRNVPFLIVGDSPQAMVVALSVKEVDQFLANRKAAGFNSVWVNLVANTYTGGRPDGSTYDGILPFTTPGDLSTPNEAYFSRADEMIRLAGKYGITVFLDPIETGGWLGVLLANGSRKDYAYGRYLGRRYKKFPNIVWFNGNDFRTWSNPSHNVAVKAVAGGIRSADPTHIQTVELNPDSSSLDDPSWRPFIQLDAAYTYRPTYPEVLQEYNQPKHLPVFMVEANYEFENDYIGPETLRRQEYWSLLSGATGQLYGNKYTWQFLEDWKAHLNTSGSRQMTYVVRLFSVLPWFNLVPDQNHTVVTQGYGTFSASGTVNDNDYVAAAHTPDGKLVMAYLPTRRKIVVDMTKLSGPVQARWFDPAGGTYSSISKSRLQNAGTRQFAPPGKNRDGDDDWVLVLTAR